ncbi:MAG TPA: folylpolyglutamate synthase/dihydrofolate synthase family protein [Actinomycetota bacterium]|nr:folylpolyglutamate synthase/dihydrofolate synthase family protein [Actinomycetota bacterium]
MEFADVLADLEARRPERVKPSLDRIRALTDLLDDPQHRYRTVHVAGTNGKTTTARLIGRILCAHGATAGVYTSPHLTSVTERLALCDQPIWGDEMAAVYTHLKPYLDEVARRGDPPSYFETLTALAFLWMADKPVEIGVFEVGMGGTWDATNLVRGEVAAICRIGLDHAELGSTVEEVAAEKAGVIKEGATVVVEEQPEDALRVIEARAAEVGAEVRVEGDAFAVEDRELAVGGQRLAIRSTGRYEDLFLPLHGPHQAHNAAVAVAAAEAVLESDLEEDVLREALAGARSPGRLEVVSSDPLVLLDGAHNPDGAEALTRALGEGFVWRRLHLVIGVLREKDLDGILEPLAARVDVAYACSTSNPRVRDPKDVAAACLRAGIPATEHASVVDALDAAHAVAAEDDVILVTGSLSTVGDARPRYAPA